jgi:hypothetical protein
LDLPALVTSSPLGTPLDEAGVLGQPDTRVLFGDEGVNSELVSGGRITLGLWCDPRQRDGIQATYFGLVDQTAEYHSARFEEPIVARPYFDVVDNIQASELVAYPDVLAGQIDVRACTRLQGAEVLLRHCLWCGDSSRLDLLSGYRFGQLFDRLTIDQSSQSLDASSGYDVGTTIDRFDSFQSVNDFHGGEAGLVSRWGCGRWSFEVTGKVALGRTWTGVAVNGGTSIGTTGSVADYPGGLLALPTNIGRYRDSDVTVLSELGVALRYHLTYYTRLSLGYDLLGWNHVSRAPELIDLGLNPTQIPSADTLTGEARPEFSMSTSDFWAQGLSFRLVCQF